jgi:trehalose-6-phosphatase
MLAQMPPPALKVRNIALFLGFGGTLAPIVSDPAIAQVRQLQVQTKADTIETFMAEPPFIGRTPVFAGDDLTVKTAFARLTKWDSVSVKVGDERSIARYRVIGIGKLHDWLRSLVGDAAKNDQ